MSKITVKEAAEFMGFTRVGHRWYCDNYLSMWDHFGVEDFGSPLYIGDGDYADNKAYTGKEVIEEYEKWKAEFPEEVE